MTDYAKHIAVFEAARKERVNGYIIDQECLDAAIELMRAAAPKSPEEERELVQQVAAEIPLAPDLASRIAIRDQILDLRAAARAEGYAQASAEHIKTLVTLTNLQTEHEQVQADYANAANGREYLGSQLSAAKAEIERLRERETQILGRGAVLHAELETKLSAAQAEIAACNEAARMRTDAYAQLQTKLTEHDAEIERLRAELEARDYDIEQDHARERALARDELAARTKLTNLRVAAKNTWAFLRMARVRNAKETRDALDAAIEASR